MAARRESVIILLKMRRETGVTAYTQILDTQTQVEIPPVMAIALCELR